MIYFVLSNILIANGKYWLILIVSLILVVIDIILNILLVPLFGIEGAAYAATAVYFIGMCVLLFLAYRRFGCFIPIKSFIKIIIASGIIWFISYNLSLPSILLPIIYLGLALLYLGILLLFKEISKDDFDLIKKMLSKK